jgi:hypothetical protein
MYKELERVGAICFVAKDSQVDIVAGLRSMPDVHPGLTQQVAASLGVQTPVY